MILLEADTQNIHRIKFERKAVLCQLLIFLYYFLPQQRIIIIIKNKQISVLQFFDSSITGWHEIAQSSNNIDSSSG